MFTVDIHTLISLGLETNQVGDKGVQYLADALEKNKVSSMVSLFVSDLPFFPCRLFKHCLFSIEIIYLDLWQKS